MAQTRQPIFVYHYDPTDYFYIGKELADISPLDGKILLPANATSVAPPDDWPGGMIPVFSGDDWEIQKDTFWRPKYTEINFDAGRPSLSWHPKDISLSDFPTYPSLERLCASHLIVLRLIQSIRYIDREFLELLKLHTSICNGEPSFMDAPKGGALDLRASPGKVFEYKFRCEGLVFQIRHCIDALCQLTELLTNPDRVNKERMFRCNSIGDLIGSQKDSLAADIVLGKSKNYRSDTRNFLEITNALFNAIKHTHMNAEANILMGQSHPTIVAYNAPNGRHAGEITFHNHNAFHIMLGFHDAIDRILENQQRFLRNRAGTTQRL